MVKAEVSLRVYGLKEEKERFLVQFNGTKRNREKSLTTGFTQEEFAHITARRNLTIFIF